MEHIIRWLHDWNRSTVSISRLEEQFLNRELIARAELLVPFLTAMERLDWVYPLDREEQESASQGRPGRLVSHPGQQPRGGCGMPGRGGCGVD